MLIIHLLQIQSIFGAIGACIMAVVNAIASVLKAIVNVSLPLAREQTEERRAACARGL